jgi:ribosomal protein S27E
MANIFKRAFAGEVITDIQCPICKNYSLILAGSELRDGGDYMIIKCGKCRYKTLVTEDGKIKVFKARRTIA